MTGLAERAEAAEARAAELAAQLATAQAAIEQVTKALRDVSEYLHDCPNDESDENFNAMLKNMREALKAVQP